MTVKIKYKITLIIQNLQKRSHTILKIWHTFNWLKGPKVKIIFQNLEAINNIMNLAEFWLEPS